MWRSFHTHDFARVMALAEQANENESGRAMVQLQRLSLGAGSLCLAGVFPFFAWTHRLTRARLNHLFLTSGPLFVGLVILFRTCQVFPSSGAGAGGTGLPALTALLAAFVSLKSEEWISRVAAFAVVLSSLAVACLAHGQPGCAVLLAVVLPVHAMLLLSQSARARNRTISLAILIGIASGLAGPADAFGALLASEGGDLVASSLVAPGCFLAAWFLVCAGLSACGSGAGESAKGNAGLERGLTIACGVVFVAALLFVFLPPSRSLVAGVSVEGLPGYRPIACLVLAAAGLGGLWTGPRLQRVDRWKWDSLERLAERSLYLDDVAAAVSRVRVQVGQRWMATEKLLSAVRRPHDPPLTSQALGSWIGPFDSFRPAFAMALVLLTVAVVWYSLHRAGNTW